MFRSTGFRFIVVAFLVLVMNIPMSLVSDVVWERARYSDETVADISREWGGSQLLSGPVLVIPVTEELRREKRQIATDPDTGLSRRDAEGRLMYEMVEERETVTKPPVYLYPETLNYQVAMTSQTRQRGIFEVPVYSASVDIGFDFDPELVIDVLAPGETANWPAAEVRSYLGASRGLRGEATLVSGSESFALEPVHASSEASGIVAEVGDPRALDAFTMTLGLNGAQSFGVTATGRLTRFALDSDWPDPSFDGSFLPDAREVREDGFSADWTVPHLARGLPAVSREWTDSLARKTATMEVRFLTPNDFYQKAWRASRYGILFVAMTFLTILLIDRAGPRPSHPVQFLMIGLAQAVFILLLVSYAEHLGFGSAYAIASVATVLLIVAYAWKGMRFGRRAGVLGLVLAAVYGVLFLVLRSTDYALLAGSTLSFLALGGTMFATRNEEWREARPGLRWPFPRNLGKSAPVSPDAETPG
ncbi:cell envelope integrity protein CreD [Alphaproteobacteria bacterium GH1-50]|uniref:Cell envelope integrity protein CreD n=1 Tax=Kangsaoukella pontilimi TaxID=2691042 RepID=A0A7C9MIC5_9RHOB|nr:cell envelope integrity protein CreD [Kangsaoukella pontilimi]MXQ09656.1 cell envelope integrity protein CreD [Kangsaoukella pontilimi]